MRIASAIGGILNRGLLSDHPDECFHGDVFRFGLTAQDPRGKANQRRVMLAKEVLKAVTALVSRDLN